APTATAPPRAVSAPIVSGDSLRLDGSSEDMMAGILQERTGGGAMGGALVVRALACCTWSRLKPAPQNLRRSYLCVTLHRFAMYLIIIYSILLTIVKVHELMRINILPRRHLEPRREHLGR